MMAAIMASSDGAWASCEAERTAPRMMVGSVRNFCIMAMGSVVPKSKLVSRSMSAFGFGEKLPMYELIALLTAVRM